MQFDAFIFNADKLAAPKACFDMKIQEREMKMRSVGAFIAKATLLTIPAIFLIGCYTTTTINSDPSGLAVYHQGQYIGRTPVDLRVENGLENSAGSPVILKTNDGRKHSIMLRKSWSPGYLILDAILCIPTLGLACYLIYFNGKTYDWEYNLTPDVGY